MAPCLTKKDLKTYVTDVNSQYYQLDQRQKYFKSLIIFDLGHEMISQKHDTEETETLISNTKRSKKGKKENTIKNDSKHVI